MRQYKIEIICAEDLADKGVEVLEHITETLENIYGDAEWIGEHNSVSNVAISSFQLVNISHVKKENN